MANTTKKKNGNGNGDAVQAEPEVQGQPQVQAQAQVPLRKLIGTAKKEGLLYRLRNVFARDRYEEVLGSVGIGEADMADPTPDNVTVEQYWKIRSENIGTGAVSAYDPDGHWSIDYNQNGSAVIYRHVQALHQRIPGKGSLPDEVLHVDDLEQFLLRLMLMRNRGDEIIEANAAKIEAGRNAPIPEPAPEQMAYDARITAMRSVQAEFGLVGPHEVSDADLPFKLAEGLGVETWNFEYLPVIEGGSQKLDEHGNPVTYRHNLERLSWNDVTVAVLNRLNLVVKETATAEEAIGSTEPESSPDPSPQETGTQGSEGEEKKEESGLEEDSKPSEKEDEEETEEEV